MYIKMQKPLHTEQKVKRIQMQKRITIQSGVV